MIIDCQPEIYGNILTIDADQRPEEELNRILSDQHGCDTGFHDRTECDARIFWSFVRRSCSISSMKASVNRYP